MTGPKGLASIRSLDYVMLLCDAIEPMRDFYTTVLGFEVQQHVPDKYAELKVGSTLLALRRRSRPYDGPSIPEAASVQLAFRVAPGDVEIAAAELAEHGIQPLEPIAELEDFGHLVLFFADPEHNVIEIYAEI